MQAQHIPVFESTKLVSFAELFALVFTFKVAPTQQTGNKREKTVLSVSCIHVFVMPWKTISFAVCTSVMDEFIPLEITYWLS